MDQEKRRENWIEYILFRFADDKTVGRKVKIQKVI